MERVQLELEVEDFLTSLPKDLEQIARLLCEGFSAAEIARKQGVNRSSICRKIKKIQDAMMHYNPYATNHRKHSPAILAGLCYFLN